MGLLSWLLGKSPKNTLNEASAPALPDNFVMEFGDSLEETERDVASGIMPKGTRKVWRCSRDENVCRSCWSLEGKALPLREPFVLPDGRKVQEPPACPDCRCALAYEEPAALVGYSEKGRNMKALQKIRELLASMSTPSCAPEIFAAALDACDRLKDQKARAELLRNQETIFASIIDRGFDYQVRDMAYLKTRRGKAARLERFYSETAAAGLSPVLVAHARALVDDWLAANHA